MFSEKGEQCSKLTIKRPEGRPWRRSWHRSGVFVNFEYISRVFPPFLLLTLNVQMFAGLPEFPKLGGRELGVFWAIFR